MEKEVLQKYFRFNTRANIDFHGREVNGSHHLHREKFTLDGKTISANLLKRTGSAETQCSGKISIVIGGVVIKELHHPPGYSICHADMAVEMPLNTVLTEDRGGINYHSPQNQKVMKELLQALISEQKMEELNALRPLLGPDHFQLFPFLQRTLNEHSKKGVQDHPYAILPDHPQLRESLQALGKSGEKKIYFLHPDLTSGASEKFADFQLPRLNVYWGKFHAGKDELLQLPPSQDSDQRESLFLDHQNFTQVGQEHRPYLESILKMKLETSIEEQLPQKAQQGKKYMALGEIFEQPLDLPPPPEREEKTHESWEDLPVEVKTILNYFRLACQKTQNLNFEQLQEILVQEWGRDPDEFKHLVEEYLHRSEVEKEVCHNKVKEAIENFKKMRKILAEGYSGINLSLQYGKMPANKLEISKFESLVLLCRQGYPRPACEKLLHDSWSFYSQHYDFFQNFDSQQLVLFLEVFEKNKTTKIDHFPHFFSVIDEIFKDPKLELWQEVGLKLVSTHVGLIDLIVTIFKLNQESTSQLIHNGIHILKRLLTGMKTYDQSLIEKEIDWLGQFSDMLKIYSNKHFNAFSLYLSGEKNLDDVFRLLNEKELLNEDNMPYLYSLFYGDRTKAIPLPSALKTEEMKEEFLWLHQDPQFKRHFFQDERLNLKMVQQAIGQNPVPFLWMKEIIKNAKEAGAKNVNINAYQDEQGKMVVEIVDDGAGIAHENLKYLYIPNLSNKDKDGGDINFGRGFFTILNAFDHVTVETSTGHQSKSLLNLKLEEGKVLLREEEKESPEGSPWKKGTRILAKVEGKHSHPGDVVELKTQLLKFAPSNQGLNITFNHEPLPLFHYAQFRPQSLLDEQKQSIEQKDVYLRIYEGGGQGIFYNGQFWRGNFHSSLQQLPPLLRGLYQQLGMKVSFNLEGDLQQNAGRSEFIANDEVEQMIARGLIRAIVKKALEKIKEGEDLNHLFPYDTYYEFRTKGLKDLQFHAKEREMRTLALGLHQDLWSDLPLSTLKESLSHPHHLLKLLQNLPLINQQSFLQMKEKIGGLLAEEDILDQVGEYQEKRRPLNYFEENNIERELVHKLGVTREFSKKFVKGIQHRLQVNEQMREKKQQEQVDELAPPSLDQNDFTVDKLPVELKREEAIIKKLHFFVQTFYKHFFHLDIDIQFYNIQDGSLGHTVMSDTEKRISLNLAGDHFRDFKQMLSEKKINKDSLGKLYKTLTHELVHYGEERGQITHDELFYQKQSQYNGKVFVQEAKSNGEMLRVFHSL